MNCGKSLSLLKYFVINFLLLILIIMYSYFIIVIVVVVVIYFHNCYKTVFDERLIHLLKSSK